MRFTTEGGPKTAPIPYDRRINPKPEGASCTPRILIAIVVNTVFVPPVYIPRARLNMCAPPGKWMKNGAVKATTLQIA